MKSPFFVNSFISLVFLPYFVLQINIRFIGFTQNRYFINSLICAILS
jgi:hypothetical protein